MLPSITGKSTGRRNRLPINWSRFPISGQGIKEKIQERTLRRKKHKRRFNELINHWSNGLLFPRNIKPYDRFLYPLKKQKGILFVFRFHFGIHFRDSTIFNDVLRFRLVSAYIVNFICFRSYFCFFLYGELVFGIDMFWLWKRSSRSII